MFERIFKFRHSFASVFLAVILCGALICGSALIVQAAGTTIYVDGSVGIDTNSGLTADAPVQSLEKAYLLAGNGGTIYVVGKVSIASNINLSSVTIARYSSNTDILIEVQAGCSLELNNVVVDGYSIEAQKAAINVLANGSLIIIGGTLQNHNCINSSGGAVYNKGTVTLTSATLKNNYSQYNGGAIFSSGTVTSNGSTFESNSVRVGSNGISYSGGAIYNYGTLNSTNDIFTLNSADKGGAIYNENLLTVIGSTFTENSSTLVGGAVSNTKTGKATMTDCIVANNSSRSGGGLQNTGEFTITNCNINSNKASSTGAGIYNTVGTGGVGIFNIEGADTLISENVSSYNGGGITNYEGILNFKDGKISDNTAGTGSNIGFGGGIYNADDVGSTINMTGGTISDNFAITNGGGIYINYDSIMNMTGGTITNNTAKKDGGGVYIMERASFNFEGGYITYNKAGQRGAGVYNINIMNMSGGSITNNDVEHSGGGIYNCEDAVLTISGGEISGNAADVYGNGVFQEGTMYLNANGKVNTDNDVYLCTGCIVTVNGALSYTDTAAIITPSGYTYGRECVRADYGSAVASDIYEQFELTPKNNCIFRPGDYIKESAGIADIAVVISTLYVVNYDANGGMNAPAAQIKYWNEDLILSSDKPSKTGYVFKFWSTELNGSGSTYAPGANYLENDNVTLYAQWPTITYIIEFDGNENTGGSMESCTFTYGVENNLPGNEFTKTGYEFVGWNIEPDGSGTSYSDKALVKDLSSVDGDVIILYAQWEKSSASSSKFTGYLRFIKKRYIDTLLPGSKWLTEPLNSLLRDVLENDLSDTSSCAQVWEFSADEFEDVQQWCREHEKGSDTNKEFLDFFGTGDNNHRIQ